MLLEHTIKFNFKQNTQKPWEQLGRSARAGTTATPTRWYLTKPSEYFNKVKSRGGL